MNPIVELKDRLQKYPDIRFEESETKIEIFPNDEAGFEVALIDDGDQYTVTFDSSWHKTFEVPEEAVDCVGFGLSDRCRLKIVMRGDSPQKWIVEDFDDEIWREANIMGLIFFPFWRRKTIIYRQNNLITKI